jgi:tetratricopeptide (TPR) repeat protein
MKRWGYLAAVVAAAALVLQGVIEAQFPRPPRPTPGQRPGPGPRDTQASEEPPRPTDPKLVELHRQFITECEKLAEQYKKQKQLDKAREAYEAILRLVPKYPSAEKALADLLLEEATTDRKLVVVHANQGWQDSGVVLQAGKPVIVTAEGEWTFRMNYTLNADGMEIPRELRDFKLGSLVGMIATADPKDSKVIALGTRTEFVAETTGRLLLRMYDADASDNVGTLRVTIQSTFAK